MTARIFTGAAVALSLGLAVSTASVTPASAGDAGAFIAGAIGGTALGAIAGSALAGPRTVYVAPPPPRPVYAEPVEYAEECHIERRPVVDPYGYVVGYKRTRICE